MKSLLDVIYESSESTPAVTKFYRANIGKQSKVYGDMTGVSRIGEVTEITFKYYSGYNKTFIFGEPSGTNNWKYAMEIAAKDNNTSSAFKNFLSRKNKEDKFFQWFTDEDQAMKAAVKAKNEYDSKKWTLKTLFNAIKKDNDLMSLCRTLRYDYRLTTTSSQLSPDKIESIYVSGSWRIYIKDGKIRVENAGWKTYEVANLQSLYMVISANKGTDEDETQRCRYSIEV